MRSESIVIMLSLNGFLKSMQTIRKLKAKESETNMRTNEGYDDRGFS